MKILVFGCSGMAGHLISLYLKEKGHFVTGFARRRVDFVDCVVGDVFESEKIEKLVLSGEYDAIINAVGILNRMASDNMASAVYVNSYFPHSLAMLAARSGSLLIHMSTDCVFAGNTGPYREDSLRDGLSFYDRTKALGELEGHGGCLTLRNSIVGPDINPNGIGLFNWFMKQRGPEINGYTHAMWTGLTTLELAKVMEVAAKDNTTGLVNMVNGSNISKYDLLKLFNHYFRKDELRIIPSDAVHLDKTLVRTNFDLDYKIPSYGVMVSEMKDWVSEHRNIYSHYTS